MLAGTGWGSLPSITQALSVHDAYLVVYNDKNYGAGEINGLVKYENYWYLQDGHFRNAETGMRCDADKGVSILATFRNENVLVEHLHGLWSVDPDFKW